MQCVSNSCRGFRSCTRLWVHHFSASTTLEVKHAYPHKHHEFEDKSHRDSSERLSCWIKGLENVGNSSRSNQLTKINISFKIRSSLGERANRRRKLALWAGFFNYLLQFRPIT